MTARAVFVCVALLWTAALTRDSIVDWISTTQLPPLLAETSVEVLDRDGALLRAYTVENGRWRLAVRHTEVSSDYIDMLIRYEDKRFWRHDGVDLYAMLRAGAQALHHGGVVSGGSTLTMQTARLLENSGTGRVTGKLRQIRLALALERRLSKAQILELYLLHAPFGGNLEGVRAASLAYFGKPPRHLSTAQAALLVALPQAPEARRPDRHPHRAAQARAKVLARMVATGHLAQVEADRAATAPVPKIRRAMPTLAPHVSDRLRQAQLLQNRHHSTVKAQLQGHVEHLVSEQMQADGRGLSAAAIIADHTTGEVLVSVGSLGFHAGAGHLDMTRTLRSPGSTLKPLVYALAYDTGRAHPLSRITDAPIQFGTYAPQNFDRAFRGDVTLDEALRLSLNTPVVQLTDMISPARLVAAMRQAGMRPAFQNTQPGLAVSLGGVGVSLEGLVRLYAGLARGGQAVDLKWKKSDVTGATTRANAPFVSQKSAWQVANTLSRLAPPPGHPRDRLAYKTGTSYGHRDAWAIGFDGRHVIGVWLGRPDGSAVPGVFGADLAAPLLFDIAQTLKPQADPLPLAPAGLAAWSASDLPAHLKHIGRKTAPATKAFAVRFPPDGATVLGRDVTLKLTNGAPPFTILVNDTPLQGLSDAMSRTIPLVLDGPGFHSITALDASGNAASVQVALQ